MSPRFARYCLAGLGIAGSVAYSQDAHVLVDQRVEFTNAKVSDGRAVGATGNVRPAPMRDDSTTALAGRAALARDAIFTATDITVIVIDGEARLYGVVDTDLERAHAADVVARVHGVENVRSFLAVMETLPQDLPD